MSEVMKLKLTCKCGGSFEAEHRYESYIRDRANDWYAMHKDCEAKPLHPAIEFTHADQYNAGHEAGMNEATVAMMQIFTDPENQPTQHGTVTVEYMEKEISREIEARAKLVEAFAPDDKDLADAIRLRVKK